MQTTQGTCELALPSGHGFEVPGSCRNPALGDTEMARKLANPSVAAAGEESDQFKDADRTVDLQWESLLVLPSLCFGNS